jgi:Methyltransferase FkbM domain
MLPLDALRLESCRLIKIDVEGMEADVLRGSRQTIKKCSPILYIENNRKDGSKALAPVLRELGYDAYWSMSPYFNEDNFYSNSVNVWPKWAPAANLLCFPTSWNAANPAAEKFLGEDDDCDAAFRRAQARGHTPPGSSAVPKL